MTFLDDNSGYQLTLENNKLSIVKYDKSKNNLTTEELFELIEKLTKKGENHD